MKTQGLFIVSVLTIILFVSLASATVLNFEPNSITETADHNSQITFDFNLYHDGNTANAYTLNWSTSDANNRAIWTALPSLSEIGVNENKSSSATLKIPAHASGTINANLIAKANSSQSYTLPITININEDDSLAITGSDFSSGKNSTTITVTNDGNTPLSEIGLTSSGDFDVTFNTTGFDLSAGEEKAVLVEMVNMNSLDIGDNDITVTAEASDGTKATKDLTYTKELYEGENRANLNLGTIDFDTKKGFGDDEDYWYPLDTVEIEFDVENNGNWDVQDIELQLCLYDETAQKCVMDEDDMDLSDDKFDLDYGDDTTITITLDVDPDELKEGNTDYTLYVSAVGKIDDKDAGDYDNDETGISASKSVNIITDDTFMVVSSFLVNGDGFEMDGFYEEPVSCLDTLQIEFTVYNIGDEDLEDHYVEIYNKDLKLYEKINLEDIDAFDKQTILYELVIPEDAKSGQYSISFEVYDEDNDILENDHEDEARTYLYFKIDGSCLFNAPTFTATDITSESVVEGGNLEIVTKLRNDDVEDHTFTIQIDGINSWANLVELSPENFELQSGRSQDINLKLKLNEGSFGEQNFNLIVYSDGQLILTQPFTVNVEEDTSFDLSKVFDDFDWTVALIIAINIILLIAIIVVAVKIIRKK